jgi:hypothetical protein
MLRFTSLGEFFSAAAIASANYSLGECASKKLRFSKFRLSVFLDPLVCSSIFALISLTIPSFSICYDRSRNGRGLTSVIRGLVIIGNLSYYLSLHNPSIRVWTLKCEA